MLDENPFRNYAEHARRVLPKYYVPGNPIAVRITIKPSGATRSWAVEEIPPANWSVTSVSNRGVWDSANSRVKWGPFTNASPTTLSYVLTPADVSQGQFSGTFSADGISEPISGDLVSTKSTCHPADMNHDWTMLINELTGYGAAWRSGSAPAVGPNPIPIDYVTRCGFLWRSGERYHIDPLQGPPLCWLLGADEYGALRAASAKSNVRNKSPRTPAADMAIEPAVKRLMPQPTARNEKPIRIRLLISPLPTTQAWAAEEAIPKGWRVTSASHGGQWDKRSGNLRFGPFLDSQPRVLTYNLGPSPGFAGSAALRGTVSFDGSRQQDPATNIRIAGRGLRR